MAPRRPASARARSASVRRGAVAAHRGRLVWACLTAATAVLALAMSSDWRDEWIAPGPLSDSHAQLIRDQSMKRCASCHQAGSLGLADWTLMMIGGGHARPPQSELCLECHRTHLSAKLALQAHSWDPAQLAQKTKQAVTLSGDLASHRGANKGQVACARCHQEHHGAEHDLTQLASGQCNTCHVRQFDCFAQHPTFGSWPNQRRTRIIFDHRSHEFKHFPEAQQVYQCTDCHALDALNEPVRAVAFEACAACHDDDIRRSLDAPLALLQLPTIDTERFHREGLDVGEWPRQFVGDFDGGVPPLLYLMLWADPASQVALRHFGPQFDFFDVDPDNFDDLEAASELVWGIKLFLYELSVDGPAAIMRRARKLHPGSADADILKLAAGLDPRHVAGVVQARFHNLRADLSSRVAMADIADQLDTTCRAPASPTVHWSYDVAACNISVRVEGHANALLTGWLELAARRGPAEPKSRPPLLRATGAGQCFSCHSLDAGTGYAALRELVQSGSAIESAAPLHPVRALAAFVAAPTSGLPGLPSRRQHGRLPGELRLPGYPRRPMQLPADGPIGLCHVSRREGSG